MTIGYFFVVCKDYVFLKICVYFFLFSFGISPALDAKACFVIVNYKSLDNLWPREFYF